MRIKVVDPREERTAAGAVEPAKELVVRVGGAGGDRHAPRGMVDLEPPGEERSERPLGPEVLGADERGGAVPGMGEERR